MRKGDLGVVYGFVLIYGFFLDRAVSDGPFNTQMNLRSVRKKWYQKFSVSGGI